ncbi:VWA-like domain-containing protein [Deinococcus sp. QL22]|uniref:vWA domain-containing protein n=1 Tax=Deinococcus sp. QL22 TaxID=2939437 RepID=UPI0020180B00|nr:VWA-like domain-containing protein [Deinococcus sp. QL22]UQN08851.1 VWA-like domain-containing protein [Deinococcus sp. QL22]
MTRLTIWTPPPGFPRPIDPRTARVDMDGLLLLNRSWRGEVEQLDVGQALMGARPADQGAPLLVSAAGWIYVDPVRLHTSLTSNRLWWMYLAQITTAALELELPRTAAQWIAGEFKALGVSSWKEASNEQPEKLTELRRLASAAMVVVADGELHARGRWLTEADLETATWKTMLRPDLGRMGWKDALKAVQRGVWTLEEIEPWGASLDVSGIVPDAGIDGASTGLKEQLKQLRRSLQGQARSAPAEVPAFPQPTGRRGVQVALPLSDGRPEYNASWPHEHPEIETLWTRAAETRRNRTAAALAYQLGDAARKAAMQRATERLNQSQNGRAQEVNTGLMRAMEDLSSALRPVLAGVRGNQNNGANERRVDNVLVAWSQVGQDIPHLRPALSELQLELDPVRCMRLRVQGMALDPETRTVYINLGAGLEREHLQYGIAELALHLLLGHPARGADKEPELWNLACDLLLAGWLEAMAYGERPDHAPYHPVLSRLSSAEAIYLRLLDDPTLARRMASLRGGGLPDMLGPGEDAARALTEDEDRLWREAAASGMAEADALRWTGTMPAGLERELRERAARPIPWRPALQAYLGEIVPRRARRRTFSRPSRRSSLNPFEPRAGRGREEPGPMHALILIVDTSGSMSDRDLNEALGGVRTTAQVLGIDRIRVLACDAGVTDHGWQHPWRAGDRLTLTGGGGTSLIPALQLAEQLAGEPDGVHPDTPMLIVTDGLFEDRVAPQREHAFLMPPGCRLLFPTRAPVFTVRVE